MKKPATTQSHDKTLTFLLSAYDMNQLPPDQGTEIAFVGYSNAGKSSALNAIFGNKKLARVSKTPGRTQAINVFQHTEKNRIVDLPGHGYAKAPEKIKRHWQQLIQHYLQQRQSLKGLVLVADIRHTLKELDRQLLAWAARCEIPVHILLTKVDKLKHEKRLQHLEHFEQVVSHYSKITLQAFSALTKEGVDEALVQLDTWLAED